MEVAKITLDCALKGSLSSSSCNGLQHIKVLPYLSVVQAVEGNYDIQLGDDATRNTGDRGFFIAPAHVQQRIVHNTDKTTDHMHCRWVFLKINVNDVCSFDDLYAFPTILPNDIKAEMNGIFDRLFASDSVFDEYICYHQIIKLLSLIATEKERSISPYIGQALRYMKENYRQKISVEDIAAKANVSASCLFAVFKKQMGISPICFLNNYRLSLAADLLLGTSKSIAQIASEVGINDAIYFNKMFKKQYQTSPTEYRSLYLPARSASQGIG